VSRVKIVTFAPPENADVIRQALGEAGAGEIGEYSFCSYSVVGKGRFLPSDKAHPHIGQAGQAEVVEEERIEVVCNRENARAAIAAMKSAHPYEEVAFDIYLLVDEEEL
jgi:hypothetical protein